MSWQSVSHGGAKTCPPKHQKSMCLEGWVGKVTPCGKKQEKLKGDLSPDVKEFKSHSYLSLLFMSVTSREPVEKETATHSSVLAWRSMASWTEEPGGLQSPGSERVRHDWATTARESHREVVRVSKHLCFSAVLWPRMQSSLSGRKRAVFHRLCYRLQKSKWSCSIMNTTQ